MADILILAAHPDRALSRVTQALLAAAETEAKAGAAERIVVRDLYRLYPDYALDVQAEQEALEAARLVVLLHPLYWYGMPGLQKLWLDEVLRFGWAYGPGGEALHGKDLWLVTSTGGSPESYSDSGHNQHPLDSFLLPYAQSAKLCGLRFLPPMVLYSAHHADDATVFAQAQTFAQRLLTYPSWCGTASEVEQLDIPLDARPPLFSSIAGDD